MSKNKLNDFVRNKIAVEISLNPKKSHLEIGNYYGVSRQLVTAISQEYGLQRTSPKGTTGSYTHPKKKRSDIQKINEKFSTINYKIIEIAENFIR